MDRFRRMITRFSSTSYDIFGLESYEDSVNLWAKDIPDITDDQTFFTQPMEEMSPQTAKDPFAASIVVHQQLENHTQQQSYELSILTRESPKFAGLELPHLSMAKQTPQPLNATDSEKTLTQMNLVQQSMTALSEPGHIAMEHVVNAEEVEKTFEVKRTDLDTSMDDICSFDTPAIISIHDTSNLQSYEDSLSSKEELNLVSGHNQQLIPQAPTKQAPIKMPDEEEIQQFVETFKKRRFQLGFTQRQVALAISKMVYARVTQYSISLFENSNMPTESMHSFKSVLQLWLEDIDTSGNMRNTNKSKTYSYNMPEFVDFRLRLYKTFDEMSETLLEKTFLENMRPTTEEIAKIAESLNVSRSSVRIWFHKRRKKLWSTFPTGLLLSSYSAVATPGSNSAVMVPPGSSVTVRTVSTTSPLSCTPVSQQITLNNPSPTVDS